MAHMAVSIPGLGLRGQSVAPSCKYLFIPGALEYQGPTKKDCNFQILQPLASPKRLLFFGHPHPKHICET